MQTADQTEVNTTDLAAGAVIRVEDVHKYYELGETRVHALRGVSVEIRPESSWPSWEQAAAANRRL